MVDQVIPTLISQSSAFNVTGGLTVNNVNVSVGTSVPVGMFSPSTNTLSLVTNGSQVLTINSSGQVGINNSSPAYTLDVTGNIHLSNVAGVGSSLYFADGTSQTTAYVNKAPTQQIFTSGTGTYTLPAGAKWIKIRMVAAGGGGGGGGTSAGTGGTGGATTFGTSFLTCNGGGGGAGSGSGSQGVGGTASGGDINVQGGYTDPILSIGTVGNNNSGRGAASAFGGGGAPGYGYSGGNSAGGGGLAYGCGGGGGGGSAAGSGSGGAGGGYLERLITSPAATYSYAVGTGGTGGTAGTSGSAGGSGGTGVIIVEEHYNY